MTDRPSLPSLVRTLLQRDPALPAIEFEERWFDWGEVQAVASDVMAALDASGIDQLPGNAWGRVAQQTGAARSAEQKYCGAARPIGRHQTQLGQKPAVGPLAQRIGPRRVFLRVQRSTLREGRRIQPVKIVGHQL